MGSILKEIYHWGKNISGKRERDNLTYWVKHQDDDKLIEAFHLGQSSHIKNIYFFSIHENADPTLVTVKAALIKTQSQDFTLVANVKEVEQNESKWFVETYYTNLQYGTLYKAYEIIDEIVPPKVIYVNGLSARGKEKEKEKDHKDEVEFLKKAGKEAVKEIANKGEAPDPSTIKGSAQKIVEAFNKHGEKTKPTKSVKEPKWRKPTKSAKEPTWRKPTKSTKVPAWKKTAKSTKSTREPKWRKATRGRTQEPKSVFSTVKDNFKKAAQRLKHNFGKGYAKEKLEQIKTNLKGYKKDLYNKKFKEKAYKAFKKAEEEAKDAKKILTKGKILERAKKAAKIADKVIGVGEVVLNSYEDFTSHDRFKIAKSATALTAGAIGTVLTKNPRTGKKIYDATRLGFDLFKAGKEGIKSRQTLAHLFRPYNIAKAVVGGAAFVVGTVLGSPLGGIALAGAAMDLMDLGRDGVKYLARKYQQHTTHKNPYRQDYKKPMVHQPDALRVNRTIIDKNRFHTKASDDLFIKKLEKVARQKSAQKRKNTVKVNHAVINKNLFHEKGFDDFYIKELHKGAQQHTQKKQQSTRKHSRTRADKKVTQNTQAPVNITNQITMTGNTDIKTICETVLKGINDKLRDSVVAYG